MNLWNTLTSEVQSNRSSILHNIDDIFGNAALTIGKWKIVNGTTYDGRYDGWYGPQGDRDPNTYSYNNLVQSAAGNAMFELGLLPTSEEIA